MPDITADKLPLTTPDITAELLERLREVAPQVFCEGKVDFDKLKETLGEATEGRAERYGLSWAGKSEAFRNVQIPSVATLLPQPAESVAWDTTENQIIEGDNLEVLKLLQKPYHGKIKMIYIDPPYNTGNEFIYPDNYREGLKDYLRYSGQVSEEGVKQSTNTETSGRFHSNWLSMMYPRLFLARNLLREDGVIFVSIDDNEVHNLRMLMNEVFGEENFVASLVWEKAYTANQTAKYISNTHDYILIYCRDAESAEIGKVARTEEQIAKFINSDNDPRGPWKAENLSAGKYYGAGQFPITGPMGDVFLPPPGRYWRCNEQQYNSWLMDKRITFGKNETGRPMLKKFLSEMEDGLTATTWWEHQQFGTNKEASIELKELFGGESVFETPKPTKLLKKLIGIVPDKDAIILDFFAGSGVAASGVLELNKEDGGKRKFILIQLPEKTENPKYPTIAHITRERVRRVIAKLKDEGQIPPGPPLSKGGNKNKTESLFARSEDSASLPPLSKGGGGDLGFRAFKLSSSNFKIWDADTAPTDTAALAEQLKLYADNVEDSRDQQDILFELILKTGLPLSSHITTIDVAGGTAYSVDDGKLLICLENPVSRDTLRAMTALKPTQMLCLDTAFHGDDALKTNTVLEARAHGVVFRTV
jgi:adenine-specific DNA-methyltransferase